MYSPLWRALFHAKMSPPFWEDSNNTTTTTTTSFKEDKTTPAARPEKPMSPIAVQEPVQSSLGIAFDACFGSGDWADDEEIGEAYLNHVDTPTPSGGA